MWIHNDCIESFGLHELTLYAFEGLLPKDMMIHNDCMETVGLHELISHDSEGATYFLLYIHIVNIDDVSAPY